MARENDPSDRMQVKSRGGLLHPGSCLVCGSGDTERTFVDLGVFFDYEGQMYLCNLCLTEAAELIGMFTPEQVEEANKQAARLLEQNMAMEEELNRARPIIDSVLGALAPGFLSGDVPPSITSEELPEADGTSAEIITGSTNGEPAVEEHVGSERRTDISGSERSNGSKPAAKRVFE